MALPVDSYPDDTELFDVAAFREDLGRTRHSIPLFKKAIEHAKSTLDHRFREHHNIRRLINGRAWFMDQLLRQAWAWHQLPEDDDISLVAVGGYGRGELHPCSDIDLLVLMDDELYASKYEESLAAFLTFLWDIKLAVGSSVRTVSECYEQARDDLTIATNLLEARTLIGPASLRVEMQDKVTSEDAWSSRAFFKAKCEEQRARYEKTQQTGYNLEPNIKNSPGGLRDIQTIGWVVKRHYGAESLSELVSHGFLTVKELESINQGLEYLWTVRYALHMFTGREEDRLLFDYQQTLATFFGYENEPGSLAIEQFMCKYYRVAGYFAELNDLLLQHFEETILTQEAEDTVIPLNNRFQIRNQYLEVTHDKIFQYYPFAMMELFVLRAQHPEVQGVRAATIRLLRQHRHLIDDKFRADIRNTSLFMELLRSQEGVSTELNRMRRYGILGRYIPSFNDIIGRMQHDLFHVYTVDAHTMKVLLMMRQFRHPEVADRFPIVSSLIHKLPKIELLYLAGLFHDIGKGRGGDHSELGAQDALAFCRRHKLPKWDTALVVWLVRHHLLMSMTAQRRDISDPEVIKHFAMQVRDPIYLDYLFVLTVADINATNPNLWNSWRAALLRQLFSDAKHMLRKGLDEPINISELIEDIQKDAMEGLQQQGLDEVAVNRLWRLLPNEYFVRESVRDIIWHTEAILNHLDQTRPLILIRETTSRAHEGGTQIFIYTLDQDDLFAATTAALSQLNLNIHDARIITSRDGFSLDTFIVLNEDNQSLGHNPQRISQIRSYLEEVLSAPDEFPDIVRKRVPRQFKHFTMPTQVHISDDANNKRTVLEVISPDRPGLLATLGKIFYDFDVFVQTAKIASMGERVEDVFFITTQEGKPLEDPAQRDALRAAICQQLDELAQI
ncbi:protein-PII uridylyltransferase [Pokkaliibacter plantistimulans]|uniref:Bifunctional uridylyltransferase/uridylyl-removing enzyme n=1 Tax=Pokkaliibacter plantistimulans TaxID=1635171 RepID=A0ABX5M1W8_9GAMM|nr:[protein-PII] uridylyltransferase [Pokkaliibacter plantistimulans]PXF32921.1 protein-PII uridylyltransferase [Pokkaliibacter plantistimulans]